MVSVHELPPISPFESLSPAARTALAACTLRRSLPPGAMLFRQGEPCAGLFILLKGRVKLYRRSQGRAQIFAMLGAGDTFGVETLPAGLPAHCTAETLTLSEVLFVAAADFQTLTLTHHELALCLLELIGARLRQFTALIHSLTFRDVAGRLAEALLTQPGFEGPEGWQIPRALTHQELAALVGTAREVISRTLKKFEKAGLLQITPDLIIVPDREKLRAIALQEIE